MDNLKELKNKIAKEPSQMHVDNSGFAIASEVLDIALSSTADEVEECLDILSKVFALNNQLPNMPLMFSSKLLQVGMSKYSSKEFKVAERIFSMLSEHGDSNGKNNYAYMIRRNETTDKSEELLIKAIYLLKEGVINKEPFSFVNLALLMALRFGGEDDWKLSDDLMKEMPDTSVFSVRSWWADVANDGDVEGFLVHYFLLRHKKMDKSDLGDKEQLSKKLSEEIEGFPEWLIVQPRFESLDDVFDAMLEEDFDDSLTKYLNNMPRTRKSAEEILEEMTQWDEWDLYKTLLQDYMEFLTPEEIRKTIRAYKKKFIMPLSSILDESVIKDLDQDSSEEQHDE